MEVSLWVRKKLMIKILNLKLLDLLKNKVVAFKNVAVNALKVSAVKENKKPIKKIYLVHQESCQIYGSPRIQYKLKSQGISCGKNRVARLMRENNLFSCKKKKFKTTTNSNTVILLE